MKPIFTFTALLLAPLAALLSAAEPRPRIELVKDAEPSYIVLAKTEHKGVMAAAKDLQRDITKITGVTPGSRTGSGFGVWGASIAGALLAV